MSKMFNRQRIEAGSRYLTDESKMSGKADNVIAPYDESELREAVRYANSRGIPLTVSGMRTGVCGGAVPDGGDVVSMEHMSGVVGIGKDRKGYYIRALPCTTIEEIDDVLRLRRFDGLQDLSPGAVEALRNEGTTYFYPVDPTEMGGSIGGNVATNASGPRTYKYGPTRDWVRRIRVVFAEGNFLAVRRGEFKAKGRRMSFPSGRNYYSFDIPPYDSRKGIKNSMGPAVYENMDLIDLFIGSEGAFGIITEVEVRIIPRHPLVSNMVFFPDDVEALAAVSEMKADKTIDPEFLEYMDGRSLDLLRSVMSDDPSLISSPTIPEDAGSALFFDIQVLDDLDDRYRRIGEILSRHGSSLDYSWCGRERGDRERMRSLRHAIPMSIFEYIASLKGEMPSIHKMGTDMCVLDRSAEEMMRFYSEKLDAAGLQYVVFGHAGDNHPHVEIMLRSMEDFDRAKEVYSEFARKAIELGGSPSAEHGVGKMKTEYMEMMYGKDAVDGLRRVKSILDPNGIMCPGNLVGGRE